MEPAVKEGAVVDHPSPPPSLRRRIFGWLVSPPGVTFLVIAAFMLVGGYARLADLAAPSLWNDEANSTLLAFSVLQHGYPVIRATHLINNWEPLYPYLEAAAIAALGRNSFAYRIPSALLGIALIPISYWVGTRFRDRYIGITLAAMVAFSTEYIAWSRQARWYMLFVVIMALGFLVVLAWPRLSSRPARALCALAAVAALTGLAVTSLGLFLLYVPGILAGALAFGIVARWESIRRFFRGPTEIEAPSLASAPPRVPYRYRLPLLLLIVLGVVIGVMIELGPISVLATAAFTRVVGFRPYPPVWSDSFRVFLVSYYPALVVLSIGSTFFIARRRNPIEVGLLAFCAASFVSVSVGASITNPIAQTGRSFERHIIPLLYFLFLLSAVSIVGIVRWLWVELGRRWPKRGELSRLKPALYGAAIVAMLVVPSAIVPTSNVINTFPTETPLNSWIPWVPFSVDPQHPSLLYNTLQPNYQLASEYVKAHRSPGDAVGATNTGAPDVYLGSVQYWIRPYALPNLLIYVNGTAEFNQNGAVLVANTSQLEGVLFTSPGWFISDILNAAGSAFPGQMSRVVNLTMTVIRAGSDPSITLYHWNRFTPTQLAQTVIRARPNLNATVGQYSLQGQLGWVVTVGSTSDGYRNVFAPLARYLLPLIVNSTTRGHGVLFNVYNNRPDLQQEFPSVVTPPYGNAGLFAWACSVASGRVSDPAYPVLAPYESLYCG